MSAKTYAVTICDACLTHLRPQCDTPECVFFRCGMDAFLGFTLTARREAIERGVVVCDPAPGPNWRALAEQLYRACEKVGSWGEGTRVRAAMDAVENAIWPDIAQMQAGDPR